MNYYLHLKSNFDAIIEVNKTHFGTVKNNSVNALSLEIEQGHTIFLKVLPISYSVNTNNLLPYVTKLTCKNNLLEITSDLIDVTNYPNNNYELTLNKNVFYSHEMPDVMCQESFNIKNEKHTFTVFNDGINQVTIQGKELLFTHKIVQELKTAEVEKIKGKDVFIITAKTKDDRLCVLIVGYFNNKYQILKQSIASKIEHENNNLTILTKLNDIAKHGLVEEFEIINQELKLKKDYTVYIKEKPKTVNIPELVPYAFLEAIKVKNFLLARSYLTEELSSTLQDEHLSEYFGDFTDVKPPTYEKQPDNKVALVYKGKKTVAKVFNVKLEKNKISNFADG